MRQAVDMLRQLQHFDQFAKISDVVNRMEDELAITAEARKPIIHFDSVPDLKGLRLLNPLYQAIERRQVLRVSYQSFKARQPVVWEVYPHLLKEYRNRWFLIGEKSTNKVPQVNIFALDRIHSVEIDNVHPFKQCVDFDPEHFFDDTVGVTKSIHDKARRVVIIIDRDQAPYVETKPLHKSQKVEQRHRDGSIQISLKVVINNKLERLILGYGGHAEVIAPPEFRNRIAKSIHKAANLYRDEQDGRFPAAGSVKLF